jgi:hypothetical protein
MRKPGVIGVDQLARRLITSEPERRADISHFDGS